MRPGRILPTPGHARAGVPAGHHRPAISLLIVAVGLLAGGPLNSSFFPSPEALIEVIGTLSAVMVVATSAWAQTGTDPAVGGAVLAVNVEVVAVTGYRASKLLGSDIYNDPGAQ